MGRYLSIGLGIMVLGVVILLAILAGGQRTRESSDFRFVGSSIRPSGNPPAPDPSPAIPDVTAPMPRPADAGALQPIAAEQPGAALPVIPEDRKIVFTATLDLVVPDLPAAVGKVEETVAAVKGFIAKSEVKGDATNRRTATFTVRVPVDQFRKLLKDLKALGTAERDQVDSEDKTEEIVDVQARIKNLKQEEETLNKLMKDAANRVDEVLRLRDVIKANRGEIERAEARLSTLSRLAALSTINLTLKEPAKESKPEVVPPSPQPPFEERAERTFGDSWDAFKATMQRVALVGVGLTPWLPLLVPFGVVGFYAARKAARAARETRPPEPPAVPPA